MKPPTNIQEKRVKRFLRAIRDHPFITVSIINGNIKIFTKEADNDTMRLAAQALLEELAG